jgi:Tfp pilus assembly protein PilF
LLLSSFLSAQSFGDRKEAESLYRRGIELYNAGDYASAIEALSGAAAMASTVPDYRYHLGLAYLKAGNASEAARELEATLGMMGLRRETRVLEPMVLVQAAVAYLRLGKRDTARKRVELALKRGEDSADAHYVLGLLEAGEGKDERAIEELRAAVERDRYHVEANLALAEKLVTSGRISEARESLRHAAHARPSDFAIAVALGELAFREGDPVEAEEAFAKAHRLRPADDAAAFNYGTVLLSRGKREEAIEILRPLVERESPHDAAAFNLAQAYRESNLFGPAREVLLALLARDPTHEGASFSLALVLESASDLEGAERAYRDALRLKPDDVRALRNLAVLLARSGRKAEALSILEGALDEPLDSEGEQAIREAIRILAGR